MGKRYSKTADVMLNLIVIFLVLLCILPLVLVVGISFTSESGIARNGYTFIPSEFSLDAYRFVWASRKSIINAYSVTILSTVIGTVISVALMALYAYPLSRNDFKYKNFFTFYVFFTMLFSGGIVSWYMICTRLLHLGNSIWGLILPYVMNAWYVVVLRTFFKSSVPEAIIESAKLDGAGEFRIFGQLVLPISVPGIATIALFQTLKYWNDWWLPLNFVTTAKLYNLQFFLQNLLANISDLTNNPDLAQNAAVRFADMPKEGVRMALCLVAMGPILFVYPFFQKYFIQGLTVGAVKG